MDLKEKRVLVFGTGKSGIGAAELLEDMGSIPVLYDGNEKTDPAEVKSRLKEGTKAEVFIGNLPEKEIDKLSLVVLSPGVPTDLPLVLHFKEKGLKIWGEVELAYAFGKGDVLAITGRVLPVTNQDVHLEAEFEDGSRCLGESKIYYAKKENDCRIRQVRLVPEHPQALPDSLEAIARADFIILGPGSLYTSIIPNFLVDGIADAIRRSRAVKALVLNVMTQDGETEGYTASDHVKAILHHAGPNVVDVCVANSRPVPEESLAPYLAEGAEPLRLDREEIMALGVAVREFPLCSSGRYIRHNPDELAKAVLDVWKEFRIH